MLTHENWSSSEWLSRSWPFILGTSNFFQCFQIYRLHTHFSFELKNHYSGDFFLHVFLERLLFRWYIFQGEGQWDRVSLYSLDQPRICYVDQDRLPLIQICLLPLSECWDKRHTPLCPTSIYFSDWSSNVLIFSFLFSNFLTKFALL